MVKMTEKSKEFICRYLPAYVDASESEILDALYELIDEQGFAPPDYHEYNDFGREAQRVYDDIYWTGCEDE